MKSISRFAVAAILCIALLFSCCVAEGNSPTIGIAWRNDTDSEFITNVTAVLDSLNYKWVLIDQVLTDDVTYSGIQVDDSCLNEDGYLAQSYADAVKANRNESSNAAAVMEGIDAVIFTGGEDISPTFYGYKADWHGIPEEWDYNAARDINDYVLMAYCLDNDIPILGLCRGMQMLGVVSGASAIQDIPTFFDTMKVEYAYQHRNQKATPDSYRDYASHDVTIDDTDSLMYKIYGTNSLSGCASWHHQAVMTALGTSLKVTGYTMTDGIAMIEALERTDKTFALGVQFHPEAAGTKHLTDTANRNDYMSYDTAVLIFEALYNAAK